jgi:hypothetical protein
MGRLGDKVKILGQEAKRLTQVPQVWHQLLHPALGTPHSLRLSVDPWDTESAIPEHICEPISRNGEVGRVHSVQSQKEVLLMQLFPILVAGVGGKVWGELWLGSCLFPQLNQIGIHLPVTQDPGVGLWSLASWGQRNRVIQAVQTGQQLEEGRWHSMPLDLPFLVIGHVRILS